MTDWTFDDALGFYGADTDGDGYLDLWAVGADGSTAALGLDTNHDGIMDSVMIDRDGDRWYDTLFYDVDGDNTPDRLAIDLDLDGSYDLDDTIANILQQPQSPQLNTDPTGLDPWTLGGGVSPIDVGHLWQSIYTNQASIASNPFG